MKVVAMIPIKMRSERVPGKNIKRFGDGTPLMTLIQNACLAADNVDEVYVYCSDDSVNQYLREGARYLKRPKYLDGDDANCNDIIREFMKEIVADIYVVSHATGPFTRPESIDACVSAVASGDYDSAFLGRKMQEFLWRDGSPLNFDVQHFPRTQDLDSIYTEASGAFVFPRETFLKYDRRVGVNPYIHEVGVIEGIDIDYPEDFEIANAVYMERGGHVCAD